MVTDFQICTVSKEVDKEKIKIAECISWIEAAKYVDKLQAKYPGIKYIIERKVKDDTARETDN